MKRLDLWKAKLKTAKAELRIRERNLNASTRAYANCKKEIYELERKIERHLAQPE
jgi:hypothetical protein